MMVFTSYPAKHNASFELDGTNYEATVVLKDDGTIQPISPETELPGR
jgi:hypothetical protein